MSALAAELAALLGQAAVIAGDAAAARPYLTDATESRAIHGRADAVARPASADQVAATLAWCYAHDVPLVPRGGGTGFAGGAVPLEGGVVVSLERLAAPPRLEPEEWRGQVQAGVVTAQLRRRCREQGLFYPPDPGSAESAMIGGNIATNAGGPHSFKYGVTGRFVTGLEVALAPGELVRIGGSARKDVAGYDLRALLVGSEGTLGIVTGAWLALLPAPELALPVVGLYPSAAAGCAALMGVFAAGVKASALEFLDEGALVASLPALVRETGAPARDTVNRARFMLIGEADGAREEAEALRRELQEAMAPGAVALHAPTAPREIAALWRWREGVSTAVIARRGGKLSEDITVPVEHLEAAIAATLEIGGRHGLAACSWGHGGDGNLHATFLVDRDAPAEIERAERAARELFELAARLGGSVSGEHGLGIVKRGALALQWPEPALALHEQIKRAFDPKGLLNPGKKLAR